MNTKKDFNRELPDDELAEVSGGAYGAGFLTRLDPAYDRVKEILTTLKGWVELSVTCPYPMAKPDALELLDSLLSKFKHSVSILKEVLYNPLESNRALIAVVFINERDMLLQADSLVKEAMGYLA